MKLRIPRGPLSLKRDLLRSRRARSIIPALTCAAAVLAGGSSVSAAIHTGGYVTESASVHLSHSGVKGVAVQCPSGDEVVSGGARFTSPDGANTPVFYTLIDATPIAEGTGFYAAGERGGTHGTGTLKVVVQCLPTATIRDYTLVEEDYTPGGSYGLTAAGTAQCPDGYRVVTGGAWFAPSSGGPDASSWNGDLKGSSPTPGGDGWYAEGDVYTLSSSLVLHVLAACLPNGVVGAYTTVKTNVSVGHNGTTRKRALNCPNGMRVVGGGVSWWSQGASPVRVPEGPWNSSSNGPSVDGKSWYAAVATQGSTPGVSIHFLVFCRPT